MKKTEITLFRLPWNVSTLRNERENWFQDRVSGLSYYTDLEGEQAAEEAFHITNAPEDYLTDDQKEVLLKHNFKGPSLLVGDVVRVESVVRGRDLPEYYLCKSFGWEKFDGDRFHFLRHLI